MRRGYISVFFAVSMALFISMFSALVYGVSRGGSKLKAQCAIDTAMISQLAQYNQELFRQYGLIFVDSSYGTKMTGLELSNEQLKTCLKKNFDEKNLSLFGGADLYGLKAKKAEITAVRIASDNNSAAIVEQAVTMMNYKYGIGYIEELLKWSETIDRYRISPDEYLRQAENAEGELESEYEITDYQGWVNFVNPDASDSKGYEISSSSILYKLGIDMEEVSEAYMDTHNLAGERPLNRGNLVTKYTPSHMDQLVFTEYVYETVGSLLNLKENSALSYQKEYVIAGKEYDIENLEIVAKKIMYLRLAANIISLLDDSERMEAIKLFSELLMSLLGAPDAAGLVETVIVAGWSYFETLRDLPIIYAGNKVPFFKNHSQWRTGLSGIFGGNESADETEGLSYEDYLRIFIFMTGYENVLNRFMNLVESDIRITEGNQSFRIDNCYDIFEAEFKIVSKRGFKFEAKRMKGINE